VRDDAHAEASRPARDFLTDSSEAQEAERLVPKLFAEEFLLLPLALFHRGVCGGEVSGQRQGQAHRQFGDADAVGARRVHDDDAARAGGRHVNVVHPRARARDDAQRPGGRDQTGRDFGRTAHDQSVGVGDVCRELLRRASSPGVNIPAFGVQKLQCGCREIVGDNYFHDATRTMRVRITWMLESIICGSEKVTSAQRWCKPLNALESAADNGVQGPFSTGFSTETVSTSFGGCGIVP
jgi:hypothetical protein